MSRKHSSQPASSERDESGPGERLQKVLAAAGVGSRRDCEELIRDGRVAIDKQTVTELGTRVDPLRQEIRVDGEALRKPKRQYFAVNKPVGVVTTSHDPSGRERVIDLVPTEERVFAVGRLDRSSEGLILVTNDGEFANRITHPRYGVEKTYLVRVAGAPDRKQLARLTKGVHLAEGYARAQSIAVKKKHGQSTDLMIVLNEGRNREIRRILARVGHKVLALKRIAVGPIKLGDLPLGAWRKLLPAEVESLLQVAKEKRRERKARRQETGDRRQETAGTQAKSTSEGPPDESRYVQKQALLAEPLSLDDLLRDDMEEGPLTGPLPDRGTTGHEPVAGGQGGVIDYEDDAAPVAPSPRPQPPFVRGKLPGGKPVGGKRPSGKRPPGKPFRAKEDAHGNRPDQRDRSGDRDQLPREDFGRKRGGKRALGPPHEGRGLAGKTAGNVRFRKKAGKKAAQPQAVKARRGAASVQQKFAGKKTGTPGKKFGKPGGKPGGKRKGRRG
jgi:23S rRNA pseudouridine2605 synthase